MGTHIMNGVLIGIGIVSGIFALLSIIIGKTLNLIECVMYHLASRSVSVFDTPHRYRGRDSQWEKEVREKDYSEGFVLSRSRKPVAYWTNVIAALTVSIAGILYPLRGLFS